jgi:hypothetical protein
MNFEERLRAFDMLGGQRAPLATDGIGTQVLYQCRVCRRTWLQDGKSTILDLPAEQVQRFAQELSADLEHLPAATCRICLWRTGGGSVEIDEYDRGEGFGFCWEIPHLLVSPLVIHAISAILSEKGASNPESRPDVLTQKGKLRAVLRAVKEAHLPSPIQALPLVCGQLQATSLRPGFGQAGTDHWQWQGWLFPLACPPLGGHSIVTLMLALPPTERVSPGTVFRCWQFLMELTSLSGMLEDA